VPENPPLETLSSGRFQKFVDVVTIFVETSTNSSNSGDFRLFQAGFWIENWPRMTVEQPRAAIFF
jgi:hypothetical protein